MSDICSFFQLINNYRIEIPMIQRDYAQGRMDSRAQDVRKSIVKNIFDAVKEGGQPLFFDFVYGRVDGDKFIPFDGQQRLTTLFLFHKYIFDLCTQKKAVEENNPFKDSNADKSVLKRFSYHIRQSSREFCERLVDENVVDLSNQWISNYEDVELDKETEKISELIKRQPWFYYDWEKDPTVSGMLRMLDEIHEAYEREMIRERAEGEPLFAYEQAAKRLMSEDCPITFHFVDMGKHRLSDETYVRMNARGKTLTAFENFKASLEEYLHKESKESVLQRFLGEYQTDNEVYSGIDGQWLDLFWNEVNADTNGAKEVPDALIMSFFNRHLKNVWSCASQESKKEDAELESVGQLKSYPGKEDFVSWGVYEQILEGRVSECLLPLFNLWDKLVERKDEIKNAIQPVWSRDAEGEQWSLFEGKKERGEETYASRVAFYGVLKYFERDSYDEVSLKRWMRVVWNIVENASLTNETYPGALRLIKELSEGSWDIYDWLKSERGESRFATVQMAEEREKARQILSGDIAETQEERERLIEEAESYSFFCGQIFFLFTDGEGNVDWKDFGTKWRNAQKYFKRKVGVREDNALNDSGNASLLRALISRFSERNFNEVLWWWHKVFNNRAETWRYYLINRRIAAPVHDILLGNTDIKQLTFGNEREKMLWQLTNTALLDYVCKKIPRSWIRWYHGHTAIFPSGKGIFLNAEMRDRLLKAYVDENYKIPDTNFLFGSDIDFVYKDYNFQWRRTDYVYLMEKSGSNSYIKRNVDAPTEEERYYCFNMRNSLEETDGSFAQKLDALISTYQQEQAK